MKNNICILFIILLLFIIITILFKNSNNKLVQNININDVNDVDNINDINNVENFSNIQLQTKARRLLKNLQIDLKQFFNTKKKLDPKTINDLKDVYINRDNSQEDFKLYKLFYDFFTKIDNSIYLNYFLNEFIPEKYLFPNNIYQVVDTNILITPGPSPAVEEKDIFNDKCCDTPCPAPAKEGFSNYEDMNLKLSKYQTDLNEMLKKNHSKEIYDKLPTEFEELKSHYLHKVYEENESEIENFENIIVNDKTIHKHTDVGQIKFKNEFDFSDESLKKNPENLRLLDDYNFIPENVKQKIFNNTIQIEKNLLKGNQYLKTLFKKYDKMIMNNDNKEFLKLRQQLKTKGYEEDEKNYIEELEKDKLQDKRLKEINNKIKSLEDSQNKIDFSTNYNSIKSFNDGQSLSIINHNDDYKIKVNDGCLSYSKNKLGIVDCISNNITSLFNMKQIKNTKELNENLEDKVKNEEGIYYPFHILKPKKYNNKCINMDKLKMGVQDCKNEDKFKWEGLKTEKRCSKYN